MHRLSFVVVALALGFVSLASAQTDTKSPAGLPQGTSREQMWFAPTEEDWKKPCSIPWQRSWEDALIVAKESKKAILVCINMDGEIASEHYAGVRYRDPAIVKLYEAYIPVIASVYRHTPRDHDEEGNRIPCPRFGTVTCGEHITIEPILFEKFMEGKRISPRHIGVEVEEANAEMYDVYYAWDTDTIFNNLKEGVANRKYTPTPINRSDKKIEERVESVAAEDRVAVEQAYKKGDHGVRRSLLAAASKRGGDAPTDLLRLSIFGLDEDLKRIARETLAQGTSERSIDLILEALRSPMPAEEREALVAALRRIGETSARARTLATVYEGLKVTTSSVDVEAWTKAMGGGGSYEAPTTDRTTLQNKLETRARAFESKPEDAGARLDYAESILAVALGTQSERRFARVMYEDAEASALAAEKLGITGWRVDAAIAIATYNLGRADVAFVRAGAAVKNMPPDAASVTSASVMALFAESRQRAIAKASKDKATWPPQWLTDVNAAYSVLAKHPFGTDRQVVAHYDFLNSLQATGEAANVLDAGLARFKDSWILHDRMRTRILAERGVDGLELVYNAMLAEPNASPNLEAFAGYATLVAAEFKRRAQKQDQADAAYQRGIALYDKWIARDVANKATGDHFVALALAGRARLALERGELDLALDLITTSFKRGPSAAASPDGLNLTPVDTAKLLRTKLAQAEKPEMLAQLQAAIAALDPEMLKMPEWEREIPGARPTNREPRRPAPQAPPK
ncbi:MAG: hypothetical protein SGI72_01230 [Planctomycetota bacterium]|nr:hypothetical protein [Planctomycetota bacterium]